MSEDDVGTDTATLVAGRYRLMSVVGTGGSARVHLASDLDGRLVAIKLLIPPQAGDPGAVERFTREVAIARSITHRNVVRALNSGTHRGAPYLVMEWVPGRSLAAELAERGPLPAAEAVPLLRQILAGLDEIHRQRVLVLDLKPANVVVERRTGIPRLVDFGAAARLGEPYLIDGDRVAGTPPYMAPEQHAGAAVGPPTDLYAAGVILHEMLTGLRPGSALEVSPDLQPPALGDVVRHTLAASPEERYRSAWELTRAVDTAMARPAPAVTTPRRAAPRPAPAVRRRQSSALRLAADDFERALSAFEQLTERFERFTWTVAGWRGLLVVALLVLLLAGLVGHLFAP